MQIDGLNRSNADLAKANKSLASKLKEAESNLEMERTAAQEARETSTVLERKLIAVQTELDDVRALLEAADRKTCVHIAFVTYFLAYFACVSFSGNSAHR